MSQSRIQPEFLHAAALLVGGTLGLLLMFGQETELFLVPGRVGVRTFVTTYFLTATLLGAGCGAAFYRKGWGAGIAVAIAFWIFVLLPAHPVGYQKRREQEAAIKSRQALEAMGLRDVDKLVPAK